MIEEIRNESTEKSNKNEKEAYNGLDGETL